MKTFFGNATKHENLLNIIVSLALISIMVLAVSCQSAAPAPVVPSDGTPLAPTAAEEPPAMPPQIEVLINESAFEPATYNVPLGTTVVWYNNASVDHTVTARDNLFDSGSLSSGGTFKYTFEQSGELEYYCKLHPSMVGRITIE
ncbi:plastocyanin/azurin family copper-binding protein [Chloroflexota bacterium]